MLKPRCSNQFITQARFLSGGDVAIEPGQHPRVALASGQVSSHSDVLANHWFFFSCSRRLSM